MRHSGCVGVHAGTHPPRFTVALTAVADPIAGEVIAEGFEPRAFTGWLQLLSALQDAVAAMQDEIEVGGES